MYIARCDIYVSTTIVVYDKVTCRGYIRIFYLQFSLTEAECGTRNLAAAVTL